MSKTKKIEPPDLRQCQCLKSNGASFMSFGAVPELIRCVKKPVVIVTEKKKPKGSMSLCIDCWKRAREQLGQDSFTAKPI